MGLIHLIKSFALTIRESANDGSDFSNPDADYRVLFLGEDGQLHVKDSAGTVTDIGTGSVASLDDVGDVNAPTPSDGDILTWDSTPGEWVAAPNGGAADILDLPTAETDDTLVLAPDGAGGVEFRAETGGGGGGALVFLEAHTASSSATLEFTTFISSTYDVYLFEFQGILPATNAVELYLRMGTGAGPTYDSGGNYSWNEWRWVAGGSAAGGTGSTNQIALVSPTDHQNNTSSWGLNGWMRLYVPNDGTRYPRITADMDYLTSGASQEGRLGRGQYASTTTVTGVQFLMSSGNIASGTIRCYGIAKS